MKQGDEVTIYEDPITRQVIEGKARLIKRVHQLGSLPEGVVAQWLIQFTDLEHEEGETRTRTILE